MSTTEPQPLLPPPPSPMTAAKPKGNGLAITALVFSALFFIPFASLTGLVLGIIALATGRSKPISIVAICLSGFFTFMVGIYAAIAIPAFMKYIRRSKTIEATTNVRALANSVAALSAADAAALPDATWTPATSPCGQPGDHYAPDPAAWQAEPWKSLGFTIVDRHYYQYRVSHEGNEIVVEAQGDLDCDGILAHYVRRVAASGAVGPLMSENEIE